MLTIASALSLSNCLQSISDSPRLDCEVLLCDVLKCERAYIYTWPEKILTDNESDLFLNHLKQREQGKPIAHIVGEKEFWSLSLMVNDSTLIPRPETELLVEVALELMQTNISKEALAAITEKTITETKVPPTRVADLGTGTGAIAFALASERPDWQVWGLEKFSDAMQLAQKNHRQLGLPNVKLLHSDWFTAVRDQKFHMIVSNPPYIEESDHYLQQGDLCFEPKTALVAENQGLADLEIISQQAPSHLFPQGWLLFEHGYQQGSIVQNFLVDSGFQNIFTRSDLSGHPRVTGGQLP